MTARVAALATIAGGFTLLAVSAALTALDCERRERQLTDTTNEDTTDA